MGEEALELGFYISFSGIVTFKKSVELKEFAKAVPLDRLLVETDAPYLAPEPDRGRINEPALVQPARRSGFDAEELLARLQQVAGDARVSRATVYRTLTELVNAGLLRQMTLSTRTVYEHDYGYPQHDHLYCQKCEKLIEFHSDEVARIRDAVAQEHQFRASSHRLIISGLCAECFRAKRRPRRLELV